MRSWPALGADSAGVGSVRQDGPVLVRPCQPVLRGLNRTGLPWPEATPATLMRKNVNNFFHNPCFFLSAGAVPTPTIRPD
jgi:hypothetical protein